MQKNEDWHLLITVLGAIWDKYRGTQRKLHMVWVYPQLCPLPSFLCCKNLTVKAAWDSLVIYLCPLQGRSQILFLVSDGLSVSKLPSKSITVGSSNHPMAVTSIFPLPTLKLNVLLTFLSCQYTREWYTFEKNPHYFPPFFSPMLSSENGLYGNILLEWCQFLY